MSIKGFSINGQVQKYDYNALDNIPPSSGGGGITNEVKQALLQLAQKVAYVDSNGQTYYQALYDALNAAAKVLTSITAVFNQGSTVIYTTDTLNDLKPMLTVTANYDDSTTATVTDYILSGNLTEGTSVITVSYGGKTTTFNVTVTPVAGMYTITNNLTGCTTSNSATTIAEETAYSATITASIGYTLTGATVSVTMGGTDVTNTAYSSGTISIANVTGNIVITVTATAKTLSSITAVFSQGQAVIYDTDSLDTLKQYLVVTANYSDSTTATVPSTDYTLSGTLTVGTSTIAVSYGGKTDTFTATVTEGGLYHLVEGTHTYNDGSVVTVSNRNHVKYECKQNCSSGTSDYNPYFNFSDIQTLGTNQNDGQSTSNHPLFFTIPANSEVVFTIKNLTSSLNESYNIQFNARKTTNGVTSASRVFSNTLSVTAGTASNTQSFTSAIDVGCFYVFFNTCVENCTYEFDVETTVNGTRYI